MKPEYRTGIAIYNEIHKLKDEVRDLDRALDDLDSGNTYSKDVLRDAKATKERELTKLQQTRYAPPEAVNRASDSELPYGAV